MYEEQDWVNEMVDAMDKADREKAEKEKDEKWKEMWTPEELEKARQSTRYWTLQRQREDREKVAEREHRNRDPELRAAKEVMLKAVLQVINK